MNDGTRSGYSPARPLSSPAHPSPHTARLARKSLAPPPSALRLSRTSASPAACGGGLSSGLSSSLAARCVSFYQIVCLSECSVECEGGEAHECHAEHRAHVVDRLAQHLVRVRARVGVRVGVRVR
eukprot:scaffold6842_cov46-Phaeocystis_antarctica.AAC.2